MRPAVTLGVYAAALAAVFAAAVGVGNAVGPVGTAAGSDRAHAGSAGHSAAGKNEAPSAADLAPGGLAVSQDGYTLSPAGTTFPVGAATFRFTIDGPDGRPLTDYTREHEKDLHLVVVRRDLTGYQHVHPDRAPDGTWSVPLSFAQPGAYKAYADFVPAGRDRPLTLAVDLTVPGAYAPAPLPEDSTTTTVDGYDVSLDGALVAGTSSRLTFDVAQQGRPVRDLQPHLGAYGHLVALREGDLAYLHVHPDGELGDPGTEPGPEVTFFADVPAAARYRLFLDFRHGDVVRTAAFTATAARSGEQATDDADSPHDH